MATPVITIQRRSEVRGNAVVDRPEWEATSYLSGSNTAGAGIAIVPRRTTIEVRRRIAGHEERTFEELSRWHRARRRFMMVVHSPGMVLLSGVSAVLCIGLSPLLTDDISDGAAPTPVVVDSSEVAGESGM